MNIELKQIQVETEQIIKPIFDQIEKKCEHNLLKVLTSFRAHKISDLHLKPSTGYGYGDIGRDTFEKVFAEVMGAEQALVRSQIVSGTHAIALVLFGILRPGDQLLAATGAPYDTLEEVIGHTRNAAGSLKEFGVNYRQVDLLADGQIDFPAIKQAINPNTKVVLIQRSRGYSLRNPLTIQQIGRLTEFIHSIRKDIICFVDNCYGEFVDISEPTQVGADVMAGSLIKNPGGGLAPAGGYVAGLQQYVELAAYRLTAPGIGGEVGCTLHDGRLLYQGLFMAPQIVGEALKGAVFASKFFEILGYKSYPYFDECRSDIIQALELGSAERMVSFCQGLQQLSPVDSHVKPIPSPMPGYADSVIMAGGTFVQGSTIELGADGPIRPPFAIYLQGGLSYTHVKLALVHAANYMRQLNLL